MEKPGIELATPGLRGIALIHYTTAVFVFGCVPWLYQNWPGGFMTFVVLCPGTPEGSTKAQLAVISGFKSSQKAGNGLKSQRTDWEKPGIKPVFNHFNKIPLGFFQERRT